MIRRAAWLAALVACLAFPAGAETVEQKTNRLQQSIDRASEYGNFARVLELRVELARHLAGGSQFVAAARQYELVLASRPGKWERVRYSIELGRMRFAAGDYGGAISAYLDALHDEPKSWDASMELARAYAKIDFNTQAIQSYQHCIRLRPNDSHAYEELGNIFQKVGYFNKAIEAYTSALAIEPRAEIYLAMADSYVRQDNLEQAAAILRAGKARVPRADYDIRLGDLFIRRGEISSACLSWEGALAADPSRDDVRLKLLMAYNRINRRSDADRLLRQLVSSYPQSPLVHFMKAWILLERGDRSGARREALAVQMLTPTELVRHYNERLLSELKP